MIRDSVGRRGHGYAPRPMGWSTVALVLANLVPLLGALLFQWNVREMLALYWSENLVVGAFTLLRLWCARYPSGPARAVAIPLSLFFCLHYGLFLFVHALFLMAFFRDPGGLDRDLFFGAPGVLLAEAMRGAGGTGLFALVGSHAVSFVVNFLVGGERETASVGSLITAPYPRVVAMHACVLTGALLLVFTSGRDSGAVLAPLVAVKVAVDVAAHRAERRRLRAITATASR